jgi:hypothetical protein
MKQSEKTQAQIDRARETGVKEDSEYMQRLKLKLALDKLEERKSS